MEVQLVAYFILLIILFCYHRRKVRKLKEAINNNNGKNVNKRKNGKKNKDEDEESDDEEESDDDEESDDEPDKCAIEYKKCEAKKAKERQAKRKSKGKPEKTTAEKIPGFARASDYVGCITTCRDARKFTTEIGTNADAFLEESMDNGMSRAAIGPNGEVIEGYLNYF